MTQRGWPIPLIALALACLARQIGAATYYYSLSVNRTEEYLTSENYPSDYPTSNTYYWTLTTACDTCCVYVETTDIELEGGSCSYDYLRVYDGASSSHSVLKTVCGTTYLAVTSSGSSMYLKFRSDSSITYRGFRLLYKEVDAGVNVSLIVGVVIGCLVLVGIVITAVICFTFANQKKTRVRASPPRDIRLNQTVITPPVPSAPAFTPRGEAGYPGPHLAPLPPPYRPQPQMDNALDTPYPLSSLNAPSSHYPLQYPPPPPSQYPPPPPSQYPPPPPSQYPPPPPPQYPPPPPPQFPSPSHPPPPYTQTDSSEYRPPESGYF